MNDKQMEANQTIWPWEEALIVAGTICEMVKQTTFLTHRQDNFYAMIALYCSFWSNQNMHFEIFIQRMNWNLWIKAA